MDSVNRFHTRATWLLVRLEHLAVVLIAVAFTVLHSSEVNWIRFIAVFILIDLIGYVPGAIAYRRKSRSQIAPLYHHLYNITHSYLVLGLLVALWAWGNAGLEWAMLAVPIHVSGDRGLFGNTYKPVSLPFEPAEMISQEETSAESGDRLA